MDIEFVVQDAYALLRPEWKIAPTLEEAGTAFAESCKENYKNAAFDKAAEPEEHEELDEDGDVAARRSRAADEEKSSGSDDEVNVRCPAAKQRPRK